MHLLGGAALAHVFDLTQKLLSAVPLSLASPKAMRDGWIIYAAFGVLVCLLLWRVATQRNAGNLRASLIILGVAALVMVVWQGARLLAVGATTAHTADKTITVFAAASLTNALDDVDTAFTKQRGIKVVVSYGASSALARQIDQGAPMDVFASADLPLPRCLFFISRQAHCPQAVHVFDNSLVALRLQLECVINFLFASLSALE